MPPPATAPGSNATLPPSDLAWRVVGLVNLYRVLVATSLLVISRIPDLRSTLDVHHPGYFTPICAAWLGVGLALVAMRRRYWPDARLISLTHVLIDAVAVASILWATGGVSSGL